MFLLFLVIFSARELIDVTLLLDSDDGILWAFMGAGFGAVSFFRGFRHLRNKRLIENTPTSKCRSVALGLAEVAGTAQGTLRMPSLIGQIACYCSQVRIERYEKRGKSSSWVKIHERTDGVIFQVEDDTGRVKVDPLHAELDIPVEIEYSTDSGIGSLLGLTLARMGESQVSAGTIPAQFMSYCGRNGVSFHGRMRFFERNICPGDSVYVLGSAEALPGVEDEQGRIIFRRGKHHPWYIIAEASEKELLSKMGTTVFLHIWGGAALALACVGFLLYRFELW
jgi:hypothetical protein